VTPGDDKQQVVTDLAVTAADRALRAAAATIGQMSDTELQCKLSQLKKARKARTPREIYRQQDELGSLELDQAAYKLASQAHADGNLSEAARWYRVGAINDFADAPLKLAMVLDSLAARYLAGAESPAATREDLGLVTEAANWYLAAFLVGDLEALDPLDSLIARLDGQARAAHVIATADDSGPGRCAPGGLQKVTELPPAEAIAHCRSCRPCKAELIKLNRLLLAVLYDEASKETTDASVDQPDDNYGPRRSLPDCGSALHPEPSRPGQYQLARSPQKCGKKG